jgi:hypothetical protein
MCEGNKILEFSQYMEIKTLAKTWENSGHKACSYKTKKNNGQNGQVLVKAVRR